MSIDHTSRDANRSVVHLVSDYPSVGQTVLTVDASLSTDRGRRDGREDFILTPALAKKIRDALDTYIRGEGRAARIAERDRRAAERHQRADDENTARALAVGTRVQISDAPVSTRGGMPARSAVLFAGKVGVVHHHVETPSNPHNGVRAGRVVVSVPGVVTPQGLSTTDIHVSSLTVLPAEPTFTKGDRVEVVGWDELGKGNLKWNGPATVSSADLTLVSVDTDSGLLGAFSTKYLRPLPVPTFKAGDRVKVAAKPGTYTDGSGFVSKEFRGADVTVVASDNDAYMFPEECVMIQLGADPTHTNYVHPTFLTKAPAFQVGDVVKVLPTYAAAFWENGHPAHNKHGVVNELDHRDRPLVQVGTGAYRVAPEHLEMVVPA